MKITVNGINVNYTLDGPANAPVVTLSHSLATDLSMWDPQMTALTARYRVLRYDTRGHGGTDAPAGAYSLGRWFTAPFREKRKDVVELVRAMIRNTKPQGYAGCCHAISALDLTDKLPAIKIPTLIVVGEEDQGTPVAASQAIQAKIAGSELQVLKSAAHLANMEQPEAFTAALTSFLSRVG